MITTTLNAIRQTRLLSCSTNAYDAEEFEALMAERIGDGQRDLRRTRLLSPDRRTQLLSLEMMAQLLAADATEPDGGCNGNVADVAA